MTVVADPTRRDLAVFGVVLPVAVAVAGLLVARRTGSDLPPQLVWGAGGAVAAAYLAAPRLRRPIFVGASRAAYPIDWAGSHLVLLAVFVLVVTPIGLLVRLLGDDPMARRRDPSAPSYWTPRAAAGTSGATSSSSRPRTAAHGKRRGGDHDRRTARHRAAHRAARRERPARRPARRPGTTSPAPRGSARRTSSPSSGSSPARTRSGGSPQILVVLLLVGVLVLLGSTGAGPLIYTLF